MKNRNNTKLHEWRANASNNDNICGRCERVGLMTVDHIVPASFIDSLGILKETYNDDWNYQYLCRACNVLKAGRIDPADPRTWENIRRYIGIAEDYFGISKTT